ncbi:MAG: hypothetical protein JOZ41_08325 [Chloroflexi bacterium]|nr:hypothetical protein [Chloroflexota bacterium]
MAVQLLGPIVRVQVQRSSLKLGERGRRVYDPTPIQPVAVATLSADGVTGWTGEGRALADVHSRAHPQSKNRDGENGISVLFTSHYDAMRARFGSHLTDGIAGESLLVQAQRMIGQDDLRHGLLILARDGARAILDHLVVAEPCVEFTRFALEGAGCDEPVHEALKALRWGMRGFYARYRGEAITVRPGDMVYTLDAGAETPAPD